MGASWFPLEVAAQWSRHHHEKNCTIGIFIWPCSIRSHYWFNDPVITSVCTLFELEVWFFTGASSHDCKYNYIDVYIHVARAVATYMCISCCFRKQEVVGTASFTR